MCAVARVRPAARVLVALSLVLLAPLAITTHVAAQESKSAGLAKELSAALDAAKLDAVAAKNPATPDVFVGALYFAGAQLLVVSAQYTAPLHMNEEIDKKQYRDVYLDLSSASVPASKVFVEDLGANGLAAKPKDNEPFDTFEVAGKRVAFDGDWKKQQLSEQDYMKAFADADARYSQMLAALIAQVKKPS
jgi:hypothetical protein